MTAPGIGGVCYVCRDLSAQELAELDTLLADPTAWDPDVFEPFPKPTGDLPASYRRHGALVMGAKWLLAHGYPHTRAQLRRHYRFDTPKLAVSVNDLVANGLLAKGTRRDLTAPLDPIAYAKFYARGIEVGLAGLEQLQAHIETYTTRGEQVPLPLVKLAMEQGSRLSISQAAIIAAGRRFGNSDDDDDAFRGAGEGPVSQRVGDHRVRMVDGEARPVVDRGPGDRADFARRAEQDGTTPLPHS